MTAPSTLFTIGYTGIDIDAFERFVADRELMVVDCRLSPRSRNPDWTRKRLTERFGDRYVHAAGLGNVNYREPEAGVELSDPESWFNWIAQRCAEGQHLLLICACADVATCHRSDVCRHLQRRYKLKATHLAKDDLLPTAQPCRKPERR